MEMYKNVDDTAMNKVLSTSTCNDMSVKLTMSEWI